MSNENKLSKRKKTFWYEYKPQNTKEEDINGSQYFDLRKVESISVEKNVGFYHDEFHNFELKIHLNCTYISLYFERYDDALYIYEDIIQYLDLLDNAYKTSLDNIIKLKFKNKEYTKTFKINIKNIINEIKELLK
jgi:hypothetical protein